MSSQINLSNGTLNARVNQENGQLVSIILDGVEFFHDGGSPAWKGNGWGSSEIVPFPVFGPVKDYRVRVGDQNFPLDQHGISRNTTALPFIVQSTNQSDITLLQEYDRTEIPNSKFKPGSGRPEKIRWLPYQLEKTFRLVQDSLVCELTVTNLSEVEMPYMLAWHPAFKMLGSVENGVFYDDKGKELASLDQVIEASASPKAALALEGVNSVRYLNREAGLGVEVSSSDYNNVILWSPGRDSGMLCIEHTSQLPVIDGQNYFSDKEKFERLSPGSKKTYTIRIRPFK